MSRLKKLMEERGVSQKTLALELDIPQPVISRWTTGQRSPSKQNVIRLADYFGVNADYLLGLTDDSTRRSPTKDHISDEDVKFALWGERSNEITPEQFQEVKNFAWYILARKDHGKD